MSLNWKEIDLVISELDLQNAIVQNVVQLDFSSLYIEFNGRETITWLYICLQAGLTRIHRVQPPRRTKGLQPRFCEFLRSRIKGATVLLLHQFGQERLVILDMLTSTGPLSLNIRLWGNAANILLTDSTGLILDAFFRRPQKNEITNKPFILPEARPYKPGTAESTKQFTIREWSADTAGGFNEFLEKWYNETTKIQDFASLQEQLTKQCQAQIVRFEGRKTSLERQMASSLNPERFKQMGEILLSYKHQIAKGESWFETEDWYSPGKNIRIDLDPTIDAAQNAQRYFQKFQKARDGATYIAQDHANVVASILSVESIKEELARAADLQSLQELSAKLAVFQDRGSSRKAGLASERPGLTFTSHDFLLLIGRNAQENDELLRRHVRGNDYWLHVRDFSGGYVFIKVPRTKTVPLEVLVDAAHLAVWYSKAKGEPEVDLFYTQVKYLRRAKHGTYGMVIPTRERNFHITIDPERVAQLQHTLNGQL